MAKAPLYLGFDSSTQSLSVTAVDESFKAVYDSSINFDADLPEYGTGGGAHHDEDGLTVTAPPAMWIAALDLILNRMKKDGFDFHRVAAISGSGQQHGSVYLNASARDSLCGLKAGSGLLDQLAGIFAVSNSPIWMDSSTNSQCRALEDALGGAQATAELTGARAYERFTGNQIAKISQTDPDEYSASSRISLVSSFIASLLIGDHAPIDYSDGAGMNLMDIRTRTWAESALNASAPGLAEKLGDIAPSHSVVGPIHNYYCEEYGFRKDCRVVAFSGDNPNSFAGLRLQHAGDIAISLGTSDTMFSSVLNPTPSISDGVVFANPIDPKGYMVLVCYKNGALTRENIRDRCTDGSWAKYQEVMTLTPPGNNGNIGFYFIEPEITPPILNAGIHRFDADDNRVDEFSPEVEARAIVEAQFMSMRLRCSNMGISPASILATGGASRNMSVLRVMSDVFGLPVFTAQDTNSAALGAAYRAMHGLRCDKTGSFVPFSDVIATAPAFEQATEPDAAAHAVYSAMIGRYARLETSL